MVNAIDRFALNKPFAFVFSTILIWFALGATLILLAIPDDAKR